MAPGAELVTKASAARRPSFRRLISAFLLVAAMTACELAASRPFPLDELTLRDSTYFGPDGAPFTGRVERRFPDDSTTVQLTGSLRDGVWDGELRVYHPNGRIRFMGSLHEGRQCGEWLEEQPEEDPGSVYERLVDEIESLTVYEACP